MATSLNDVATQLAAEEVVDLSGADKFINEGGAWPVGWYRAEVIEGFATPKGKQFQTSDAVSKNGTSRNLTVCLRVKGPSGERTILEIVNYRQEDFTAERVAQTNALAEQYKDSKNWPDKDAHRSHLAKVAVRRLEKALGTVIRTSDRTIDPARLIGKSVDVHLTIDKEKGFNEPNNYAAAGSKAA